MLLTGLLLSSGAANADQSCKQEVGSRQAERLVEHCLNVSPATHPPCNAQNTCDLIRSEIERGCAMLDDKPEFCSEP